QNERLTPIIQLRGSWRSASGVGVAGCFRWNPAWLLANSSSDVQFSVITPSFRASQWLRLCIPSVADQGVELEHIVQDSVSDDGTLEWLPEHGRVKAYIEKDRGMYDAVNRGLRKAKGEILAYINCD